MSAIAAAIPQGMTIESVVALAIKALVRLVTEPEVPHETVRRAADTLLRYAIPKPEPKALKATNEFAREPSRQPPPPAPTGEGGVGVNQRVVATPIPAGRDGFTGDSPGPGPLMSAPASRRGPRSSRRGCRAR